jgi:hypothetical protein
LISSSKTLVLTPTLQDNVLHDNIIYAFIKVTNKTLYYPVDKHD